MKKDNKKSAKKWVLVLCVACLAFLVYDVTQKDVWQQLGTDGGSVQVDTGQDGAVDSQPVSGEVNANEQGSDRFYADYRIEREKTRDQSLELLQSIIDDPAADAQAKKTAQESQIVMAKNMEQELLIETLLAAKEMPDAVAFIQEGKVTVVLNDPVDDKSSGKIAEIVDGVTGVGYENVVIISRDK
jgi:hypothetical protein